MVSHGYVGSCDRQIILNSYKFIAFFLPQQYFHSFFLVQYLVHVYLYDQFKMLCTIWYLVEYLYNGMKIINR